MLNSLSCAKFAHLGLHRIYQEIPTQKIALDFQRNFSAQEYKNIIAGNFSQSMDERWDFVFGNNWLYIYRSWTGNCIFQIRIESCVTEYRTVETWGNRNLRQYSFTDDSFDLAMIEWLIDVFLLGKDAPFPRRGCYPDSSI